MKYPIRIVYDHEEHEYLVFIGGISNIEGHGETEKEAIEDFRKNYEMLMKE